jgi:ParB-like chromosome segregation protein Spo0J
MGITLTSEQIVIDRIRFDKDKIPDEQVVSHLVNSIQALGLLHPILLWRPSTGMGINLIAGRHRLEACRRLKMRAITGRVVNGHSPEIVEWVERAAADENLIRRPTSMFKYPFPPPPVARPKLRKVA